MFCLIEKLSCHVDARERKLSLFWKLPSLGTLILCRWSSQRKTRANRHDIRGVLQNDNGEVLIAFPGLIGVKDLNEVELLAFREELTVFKKSFSRNLTLEVF